MDDDIFGPVLSTVRKLGAPRLGIPLNGGALVREVSPQNPPKNSVPRYEKINPKFNSEFTPENG